METGVLSLVVLVVLAIALPLWLMLARGLSWRPERARRSLAASAEIVLLLQNVQQHRGMSGAWLAGDQSFGARLPQKQAVIERLFDSLELAARVESAEAYPCFRIADLRALHGQWEALTSGLAASTPEKSFQDHCQIVAKLLDWLRTLGEARIEQPGGNSPVAPAVRNFSFRLPTLAECLGQARALSIAAAARGQVAPVVRVRLVFLLSRAESLLGTALGATRGASAPEQDQAMVAVQTYVRAMRERLLGADGVRIPAGECFALATQAVDSVFAWQDLERRRIAVVLGVRGAAPEAVTAG
jgi:hypothetical protein